MIENYGCLCAWCVGKLAMNARGIQELTAPVTVHQARYLPSIRGGRHSARRNYLKLAERKVTSFKGKVLGVEMDKTVS